MASTRILILSCVAIWSITHVEGQNRASLHRHAKGVMKLFKDSGAPEEPPSVLDAKCYSSEWPHLRSCVKWWTNKTHRIVEGNSIPDHDEHGRPWQQIGPYCPFGVGGGYCLPEEGTQCVFEGIQCPNQDIAKNLSLSGDVPVPYQTYFEFPLNPDPTAEDLPNHMYHNNALYQQVGVHLNGVHIKGPGEAAGYEVDTSNIPLLCGGHVTPPIGPGPVYHYHKPSTCATATAKDRIGNHSSVLGYAVDGYAIYGALDLDGTAPVVDECNGHFGPVYHGGPVTYHYHVQISSANAELTFEKQEPSFRPPWIGCQGPSLSKCNTTVAKAPAGETDLNHVWCGIGCGYDICVQPGTPHKGLVAYLDQFKGGSAWIVKYTVNNFTNYPNDYNNYLSLGNISTNEFLV